MGMQVGNTIEVKDITKTFKIYLDKSNTLKERIIFSNRRSYEKRSVLNGISFEVKKGEAIGFIGHNGCGKSTTLKLLTKIMYPDSGSIEINGRVSSLIELGAGFHPDMSGRENIYINASIFGLTKKEIDKRVADIITFSELEEFIDNPVRTYSSGMYMRLAFSVAINVDADVLLIDEILAVGDVNFQQKCFERLKEIKKDGTTIVIVSHSLSQIEQICERSLWIDNGRVREEGRPREVHEKYLSEMESQRMNRIETEEKKRVEEAKGQEEIKEKIDESETDEPKKLPFFCNKHSIRRGNQKIEFTDIYMLNKTGEKNKLVRTGEKVKIIIEYQRNIDEIDGTFGIGIYREDGIYIYGTNTDVEIKDSIKIDKKGKIEIIIPYLQLLSGKYNVNIAVHSKDVLEIYDYIWNVLEFQVFNTKGDDGLCRIKSIWYHNGKEIIRSIKECEEKYEK